MATAALPQDPDLGQLRTQARELQRAVRDKESDALARVSRGSSMSQTATGCASISGPSGS